MKKLNIIMLILTSLVFYYCSGSNNYSNVQPVPINNNIKSEITVESESNLPKLLKHSDVTLQIVKNLKSPLRIRAFISGKNAADEELKQLLLDIYNLIPEKKRLDIQNPNDDEQLKIEAKNLGARPDSNNEFHSVVFSYQDKKITLPELTENNIEFQLLEGLSRLIHGTGNVGLINVTPLNYYKARKIIDQKYIKETSLYEINKNWTGAIIFPFEQRLKSADISQLDFIIKQGVKTALFVDRLAITPGNKRYEVANSTQNLDSLLKNFGIKIEPAIILDRKCSRVSLPAKFGKMILPYPPLILTNVSDIDLQFEQQMELPFTSPITITPNSEYNYTIFIKSSSDSWKIDKGFNLNPYQNWINGQDAGPFNIGVWVKHKNKNINLFVISNSRFLQDGYIIRAQNHNFWENFVYWFGSSDIIKQLQ